MTILWFTTSIWISSYYSSSFSGYTSRAQALIILPWLIAIMSTVLIVLAARQAVGIKRRNK